MVKNSMTDKSIFVNSTNLKSEIQHVILLIRIKDILKRIQKKVVEKIDNKMMLDQNKDLLIIPPYCSSKGSTNHNNNYFAGISFIYEYTKVLKRLEDNLFEVLINIINNLHNDNTRFELVRTGLKPTPSFSNYLCDIPDEINSKLNQLPEPVLYDFTNKLIHRLHKYFINVFVIYSTK
jgi:hypothetical protein